MDYPSLTSWQIRPSNYLELSHIAITTFAPHFFVVGSPTILYKRWIQNLAPHHPIMEGNGKHACLPLSDNSNRYFATQSLMEGGILRSSLWQYHEQGIHPVHEWFKVLLDIWEPVRYNLLNWEDAKVKFSLEEVH